MRKADARAFYLALARFAPELPRELAYLGDARRADGMSFGQKAAARVDREFAAEFDRAVHKGLFVFAVLEQAESFDAHEFRDREAVVHFGKIKVFGPDARVFIQFQTAFLLDLVECDVTALVVSAGRETEARKRDEFGRIFFGDVFRAQNRCCGAVPDR